IRMEGMHSQEANELFRIRLHERRGIVIHPWGFVDELAVIGHIAARIGRDVEDNGAIDAFERAHMLVPGMRSGGRLIGAPLAIEFGAGSLGSNPMSWGVVVNIDDHGFGRAPRFATGESVCRGIELLWPLQAV